MSDLLPPDHFLNLPRPDIVVGAGPGIVDTTTLAAHDFDVDTRTGFLPPDPPIGRLPEQWEPWEATLEKSMSMKFQLAIKPGLTEHEVAQSASWRADVHNLPILSTKGLTTSELLLRRAHHVLTYIMHSYIHTLPLEAEIRIPASVSIPLLEVSAHLQLPPVATYSDNVLYNWKLKSPSEASTQPTIEHLCSQDLFTGSNDEQEFYLASSRIELRGVEALELMRATMDEMFVGDEIAVRRITGYLYKLATVVDELKDILLNVRKGCDPEYFYHSIRPWLRGQDSDPLDRKWIFEGLEEHPEIEHPTDLSGPSAGQSALIHALDIFLGLDNCNIEEDGALSENQRTLLRRMQIYMPRHHRNFLRHLSANPRPVRDLVIQGDPKLVESYNNAVRAVKEFRDAHLRIVAIYIVGPASRERQARRDEEDAGLEGKGVPLKGTGGTHLVQFLKGVRDKTAEAMIPSSELSSPARS
ncbi:Indoleamine 2,3-dioxygenase [Melanogaster broomeanus]|nr:Indoleamine 2,3-dioxygenase [Melanogaster broomeanus]